MPVFYGWIALDLISQPGIIPAIEPKVMDANFRRNSLFGKRQLITEKSQFVGGRDVQNVQAGIVPPGQFNGQ